MSKALFVGFVLAFLFLFTSTLSATKQAAYPEDTASSLLNAYGLGDSDKKFPTKNIVFFVVDLIIGFALIVVGLNKLESNLLLGNMLAWPGLWLVAFSPSTLKYSSLMGFIGGGKIPPIWTLAVEWLGVVILAYLGIQFYKQYFSKS